MGIAIIFIGLIRMTSSNEIAAANALLSWGKLPISAYTRPSPISVQPVSAETGRNKVWNATPQRWFTPVTVNPNPTKHMESPYKRKNRKTRRMRKSKKTRKSRSRK